MNLFINSSETSTGLILFYSLPPPPSRRIAKESRRAWQDRAALGRADRHRRRDRDCCRRDLSLDQAHRRIAAARARGLAVPSLLLHVPAAAAARVGPTPQGRSPRRLAAPQKRGAE